MTRERFQDRSGRKSGRAIAGLALMLLMAAGHSGAQSLENEAGPLPTLEITPGSVKAFRVAVQRFREVGPPVGEERVQTLRKEIERGLAFSSVVMPLDHAAFLGPEQSELLGKAGAFDCDAWKQSGADALIQGEVGRDGVRFKAELRIWDVARCEELKTGALRGDRNELADLGRVIADEIVEALTGVRGVSATEIAFISDRTGTRQVYVMSADGRAQREATRGSRIKLFPDWVPDGRAILYVSYDGLQPGFFISSRSSDIKPGPILRNVLKGRPKYRGRFDPSGEELAMVSSADGAAELFRVNRKTRENHRLTHDPAIDISPSWSPDGRQIVFVSDRTGSPQLYIMNRDGGDLRRLSYTGSYNTSPVWSPDGRWIAYETRVRGQFDIWLIDPSGQINFPIVQHARSDEGPTWSPDSRKIAFSSRRRGRYDVYVMDWNGENLVRLTQRAGENIHADWGPQRP